ncbi:MAG: LptF/LptG family permease [Elusimicrobia bacterium]|nr:LptF/LptG family permease [Elusimicrobiota bacterium]
MPILSRYLLSVYLPPFSLCLGAFLAVLLMNYFLRLFNVAVSKGIAVSWVFLCFAKLAPYFLSLALPMAFLVALLLTLGQLSESGEIMALRASGYSFRELLKPFLAVALLLTALLVYTNNWASPQGFHAFRESYDEALAQISRLDFEPRALTRLGDWEIYSDAVRSQGGRLSGVRLIKRIGGYKRLRIAAPSGTAELMPRRGLRLVLVDGQLAWPNQDPQSHTTASFGRSELFIPFSDSERLLREPEIPELTTPQLRRRAADPAFEPARRREYATEATMRAAGAFAPLALFLVACPLGLSLERRSKAMGFALSLAVLFGYYGLLALGLGYGRRGGELAAWAPWGADLAALLAGAALWRRRLAR